MTDRGPLVLRITHRGAILYLVGVVQFVAAMAVAQVYYPGYSDAASAISDLGNPTNSPAHFLFDGSVILLGLATIGGTVLVRSAFRVRKSSRIGLGLLLVAGAGAIGVGIFPEGSPHGLHTIVSALAFVVSGIALLFLALAMLRDTRWEKMRLYTLLSGMISLAATAAFSSPALPSGASGAVERLIVAPVLLWFALASVHLLRVPTLESAPLDAGAT
ncbi:MAG: DUF998 domain-containing protein [Thermoplasmata archaeon]|nr:DUF998 domain-containing protein [Thermoplasmata archaeon]